MHFRPGHSFPKGIQACSTTLFWSQGLNSVPLEIPDGGNIIVGQSHFYHNGGNTNEAIVPTSPSDESLGSPQRASGPPSLTRADGNDA